MCADEMDEQRIREEIRAAGLADADHDHPEYADSQHEHYDLAGIGHSHDHARPFWGVHPRIPRPSAAVG
jgi:hypothetical protein